MAPVPDCNHAKKSLCFHLPAWNYIYAPPSEKKYRYYKKWMLRNHFRTLQTVYRCRPKFHSPVCNKNQASFLQEVSPWVWDWGRSHQAGLKGNIYPGKQRGCHRHASDPEGLGCANQRIVKVGKDQDQVQPQPIPTMLTKPCPSVPYLHITWIPPRTVIPWLSWAACFNALLLFLRRIWNFLAQLKFILAG